MFRVIIPVDCKSHKGAPKGAALLDIGDGKVISCFERNSSLADLCQSAVAGEGSTVTLDCETVLVGCYDDTTGSLALNSQAKYLNDWLHVESNPQCYS
jgi:hypothetical protein